MKYLEIIPFYQKLNYRCKKGEKNPDTFECSESGKESDKDVPKYHVIPPAKEFQGTPKIALDDLGSLATPMKSEFEKLSSEFPKVSVASLSSGPVRMSGSGLINLGMTTRNGSNETAIVISPMIKDPRSTQNREKQVKLWEPGLKEGVSIGEYVVDHEFGHAIYERNQKPIEEFFIKDYLPRDLCKLGLFDDSFPNRSEAFAYAFTMSRNPSNPDHPYWKKFKELVGKFK